MVMSSRHVALHNRSVRKFAILGLHHSEPEKATPETRPDQIQVRMWVGEEKVAHDETFPMPFFPSSVKMTTEIAEELVRETVEKKIKELENAPH